MAGIDFNNTINKLLPIARRKTKNMAFLRLLLHPMIAVNLWFEEFKMLINYKLQFNGQVIYLEHYLNDLYDPNNRGIYIEDVSNVELAYSYNSDEQLNSFLLFNNIENTTPNYIYGNSEIVSQYSFIVRIPSTITFNETIMRQQIDYYKISGKKYKIETI